MRVCIKVAPLAKSKMDVPTTKRNIDFIEFTEMENNILLSRLKSIRAVVEHSGEKGRALENTVSSFLRSLLPKEYGVSTGFIAYSTSEGVKLSRQLDIIIYDALRGAPIVSLDSCHIFPIEYVYAYVEVKTSIKSSSDSVTKYPDNSVERCLEINKELRGINKRYFWVPGPDATTTAILHCQEGFSIRSFLFSFTSEGKVAQDPEKLSHRISEFSERIGHPVHFHGILIADLGFFQTIPIEQGAPASSHFKIRYRINNQLMQFKIELISSLCRFGRIPEEEAWVPALDRYYNHGKLDDWIKV